MLSQHGGLSATLRSAAAGLMREGGTERTVFKMSIKLSKLEARVDYEAAEAAPLALLSMEAVHFDLAIHPSTMKLTASLGNLRGQDGQLPEVRGPGEGFERVRRVPGCSQGLRKAAQAAAR